MVEHSEPGQFLAKRPQVGSRETVRLRRMSNTTTVTMKREPQEVGLITF